MLVTALSPGRSPSTGEGFHSPALRRVLKAIVFTSDYRVGTDVPRAGRVFGCILRWMYLNMTLSPDKKVAIIGQRAAPPKPLSEIALRQFVKKADC